MKIKCLVIISFILIIGLSHLWSLDTQKIEELIFKYTNIERTHRGLSPYRSHDGLIEIARIHSKNMIDKNFFSHTDHKRRGPQARKQVYWPQLLGGVGENIAYNYGSTEKEVAKNLMVSWMNSSGHKANILSKQYTHLGVGIIQKGSYYYATQNFGDLAAELLDAIPENPSFDSELTLKFAYLHTAPKDKLTVYVYFPDKKARYYMANGSFYTGCGLYTPRWIEGSDEFYLDITLDKGKGVYKIVMGTYGSFYPEGLQFKTQ